MMSSHRRARLSPAGVQLSPDCRAAVQLLETLTVPSERPEVSIWVCGPVTSERTCDLIEDL